MQQALVKTVKAKKPRSMVASLVKDYGPELEASRRAGQVVYGAPAGVEAAYYGENTLLSYVYDFGSIRGLMPVHEVGPPVWPEYLGGNYLGPDDMWSFLAKTRRERGYVESRMNKILSTGLLLPYCVISLDGERAILSRRKALAKLSEKAQVVEGQELPVTVFFVNAKGAWGEHEGLTVFVPRHEVYFGDVSPAEMLQLGDTCNAKVLEVSDLYIRASTRAMEKDPWETFQCRVGSVRRAVIRNQLREGNGRFRVSFAPGVMGIVIGAPLNTYHTNQEINVRILKFYKDKKFILGRIEE